MLKKIAFLLLSICTTAAIAGTYNNVDGNKDASPEQDKAKNKHFYIDIGVNDYYFDGPGTYIPATSGYTDDMETATGNGFDAYDAANWSVMPTLTLGYEFLAPDPRLAKIFGEQNAVEVKASYFHNSSSEAQTYPDGTYVNPWIITGSGAFSTDESFSMTGENWDYDDTYVSLGVYYTGQKVIQHNLINSPYAGIALDYLKQDSNYILDLIGTTDSFTSTGSDDLDSYYFGLEFGDKLLMPIQRQFAIYGKAGLGLYLLHSTLDATQLPVENASDIRIATTYTVDVDDNQIAYKGTLETGASFYFSGNNQNPLSPSVTLLAGVEYWSDIAYADNPTEANQQVSIAYDDSFSPYAGLQLHYPIA